MVDTADAEKSISKTSDEAEGLGKKLSNGIKTAGKWAAGVTAGAIAVGGAMLSAAKDPSEFVLALNQACFDEIEETIESLLRRGQKIDARTLKVRSVIASII